MVKPLPSARPSTFTTSAMTRGDDLHVVRRHVGRAAQSVGGAEVGDAEAQGEDPLAVLLHGAGDAGQGLGPGLQVEQLGRFQDGHGEEPAAARGLGGGERLQEGDAALLGELRQDEAAEQPRRRRRAAAPGRESGPGSRTRTKSSGSLARPAASRSANWRTRLASAAATSASSMESSRHSTMDTTPRRGLLQDVVGEGGPGRRAVERGAEGGRQHACGRARGELARAPDGRGSSAQPAGRARNDAYTSPVLPGRPRFWVAGNST